MDFESSGNLVPTGDTSVATFKQPRVFRKSDSERFLRLLVKDSDKAFFRVLPPSCGDVKGLNNPELIRCAEDQCNLYVVIGDATAGTGKNGSVKDNDITSCRALFVEWDDKPKQWQLNAWKEFDLPEPTVMVDTGGKSIHVYWVLEQPITPEQFQNLQKRLIQKCGSDSSIQNPARVMRLPGSRYIDKKTGKAMGWCEIVHTSGERIRAEDFEELLPFIDDQQGTQRFSTKKFSQIRKGNFEPRSEAEIRAAAKCIPVRIGGEGTYTETDRPAICGCAGAFLELELGRQCEKSEATPNQQILAIENTLDLMVDGLKKWPNRKEGRQVLESSTTWASGSFWRCASENGFDLSVPVDSGASAKKSGDDFRKEKSEKIAEGLKALLNATIDGNSAEIDAGYCYLYSLKVSRDTIEKRVLERWADLRGYNISSEAGSRPVKGRIYGKDKGSGGIRPLLPGFLLDNELHVICSDAGAGKTLACAELATVMACRDKGFLDHDSPRNDSLTDPRKKVLVIASDGEGTAFDMWEQYLHQVGAEERGVIASEAIEFWAQNDSTGEQAWNVSLPNLDRLAERVKKGDICLVIIDTANAVIRGAGLDAGVGPIEHVLRLLKQIVCKFCPLVLTHHTNRQSGKNVKAVGGHSAFNEVPAVIHLITRLSDQSGNLQNEWNVAKLRGSQSRQFTYSLSDDGFEVTSGDVIVNCTDCILKLIGRQREAGLETDRRTLSTKSEYSLSSVDAALSELKRMKLIRKKGQGTWCLTPSGEEKANILR